MLLLKDTVMEYALECKVRRLSQGTIDNYDRHLRCQGMMPCSICSMMRSVTAA